jgi:hypothetical protein
MISKTDNANSLFRSLGGMQSETELTKAQEKSENSLITEMGMPANTIDNSKQQARYKDEWSTEDTVRIKMPSQIEYPNLVIEKKK